MDHMAAFCIVHEVHAVLTDGQKDRQRRLDRGEDEHSNNNNKKKALLEAQTATIRSNTFSAFENTVATSSAISLQTLFVHQV